MIENTFILANLRLDLGTRFIYITRHKPKLSHKFLQFPLRSLATLNCLMLAGLHPIICSLKITSST